MNRLDADADHLLDYFEKLAKGGYPEARRDWLYAQARVAPGRFDADAQLDRVIRRAKERGATRQPQLELIYVYDRPPCWTCRPSDYIRDRAQIMELKRARSAQALWQLCIPKSAGAVSNASVASGVLIALNMALAPLLGRSPDSVAPVNDQVLVRIDAMGIAN